MAYKAQMIENLLGMKRARFGESPLEVALATGPGADVVMNLLGRAAYSGGV